MDERIFRLDDRPAIVVGAGSGIGQAIAAAFGAVGAIVGCLDISKDAALETANMIESDGGNATALSCDVSQEGAVADAVAQFVASKGQPRILVNGAAAHDKSGTILDLPPAEWNAVLGVNLTGPYLMSRAVLPVRHLSL